MRRTFVLLTLVLSFTLGEGLLLACGDKFFLVGRGERFSRAYASLHPGNVLVYTGGPSDISKGLGNARLHQYIDRAGHRVLVAASPAELDQMLTTERVDVILADLGQAVGLVPRATTATSRPTLLPIEGKAPDGRSASQHGFDVRLKAKDKVNQFLAGIEKVMETRSKDALRK